MHFMANVCAPANLPALSNGKNTAEYFSSSGLPEQFLVSMRNLFDILDEKNTGLVSLSEIEGRWRDEAVPNLPGVLDSLRSITPADEMLNYETFVWGIKLALVRARKFARAKKIATTHVKSVQPCECNCCKVQSRGIPQCDCLCLVGKEIRTNGCVQQDQTRQLNCREALHHFSNTSLRGKHRRSVSGPVSHSEMTGTWNCNFGEKHAQKFTQMGYATKFSAPLRNRFIAGQDKPVNHPVQYVCDNLDKIKLGVSAVSTTPDKTGSNQLPHVQKADENSMSADTKYKDKLQQKCDNTLNLNRNGTEIHNDVEPLERNGKLNGMTGSVSRTCGSSLASDYYGSLKRPAMSTPFKCFQPGLQNLSVPASNRYHEKIENQNHAKGMLKSEDALEIKSTNPKRNIFRDQTTSWKSVKTGFCCSDYSPFSSIQSAEVSNLSSATSSSRKSSEQDDQQVENAIKKPCAGNKSANLASVMPSAPQQVPPILPSGQSEKYSGVSNSLKDCQQANSCNQYFHFESLQRKKNRFDKRKEQRRHTVANGVNYHVLRCIKVLNDEEKLLLQGVNVLKQGLTLLEDRLKVVHQQESALSPHDFTCACPDMLTEEDLKMLSEKINNMATLVKSFANSKALRNGRSATTMDKRNKKNPRREENLTLNKEVSAQASKIFQLEREKSLLIQQLFHAKAELQVARSSNSSTFI